MNLQSNTEIYKTHWTLRFGLPILSISASFCSYLMAYIGHHWALFGTGIFGILGIISGFEIIRGVGVLKIRKDGFTYRTTLKTRNISWNQVDAFELQKLGRKEIIVCNLKNKTRFLITEKFGVDSDDLLRIFNKSSKAR